MPVGPAMANAQNAFAPSMSTQPPPRTEQVQPTVPDVEQEEHQAVHALDAAAPFLPDGDSAHEQLLKFTDVYLRSRATPARCVPSVWSRYLFCHAMFKINMVTKWAAKAKSSLAGELYDLA